MKTLSSLLFLFLLSMVLAVPAGANDHTLLASGKRLYKSSCMICHGPDGNSVGPLAIKLKLNPANLSDKKYRAKTVEQMVFIIGGYGKADNRAMPFVWRDKLSDEQLISVASYLLVMNSSSIALRGNRNEGKIIFQSSCAACHGSTGNGEGALAAMLQAPKVGFTKGLSMKYLSDKKLIGVIKNGAGDFMPGWQDTLNEDQIIDVAAYVRSLSVWRSEPK